jgi:hypothetical protein
MRSKRGLSKTFKRKETYLALTSMELLKEQVFLQTLRPNLVQNYLSMKKTIKLNRYKSKRLESEKPEHHI